MLTTPFCISGKLFFPKNSDAFKKLLDNDKISLTIDMNKIDFDSFWKDSVSHISYFRHDDSDMGFFDLNYEHLLTFLSTDSTKLNILFSEFAENLWKDQLPMSFPESFETLYKELIQWHPFFKYDSFYFLCDTFIYYIVNNFLIPNYACFSKQELHDIIRMIALPLSNFLPDYPSHNLDNDIEAFTNYYYNLYDYTTYFYPEPVSPLSDIENLQNYIKVNIPSTTYSVNSQEWMNFFTNLEIKCGPCEKISISNTASSPHSVKYKGRTIALNEPYIHSSWYKVTSFQQYIITVLNTLKTSKCAIHYCPTCRQYYISPTYAHSKNHDQCIDKYEDFASFKKLKKNVYFKNYQAARRKCELEIFHNGFTIFHNDTFNKALKNNIKFENYKKYLNNTAYNYHDFLKLPPIDSFDFS